MKNANGENGEIAYFRKRVFRDNLARRFGKQFVGNGQLENAYWLPGVENPADGLTKLKCGMGPISALMETGRFQRGLLRPRKGLTFRE